jgi:hypothetical protein
MSGSPSRIGDVVIALFLAGYVALAPALLRGRGGWRAEPPTPAPLGPQPVGLTGVILLRDALGRHRPVSAFVYLLRLRRSARGAR